MLHQSYFGPRTCWGWVSATSCVLALACIAVAQPPSKPSAEGKKTGAIMDPYLDKLFASPNDFDLINGLFSRISYECDGEDVDELRKLPEPQRVVLQIWGASGIIGNGGFQYLFESGLADFSGIADAYDTIKLPRAAKHLAAITSLTELSLSFTQVTDAAIEHLAKLVNLKSLDLSGTKVRGRPALRQLEQLKLLEKLSLPDGLEGNANVEHLRRQLPKAKISN